MLLQRIELKGFLSYYGHEKEIGDIEPVIIDFQLVDKKENELNKQKDSLSKEIERLQKDLQNYQNEISNLQERLEHIKSVFHNQ